MKIKNKHPYPKLIKYNVWFLIINYIFVMHVGQSNKLNFVIFFYIYIFLFSMLSFSLSSLSSSSSSMTHILNHLPKLFTLELQKILLLKDLIGPTLRFDVKKWFKILIISLSGAYTLHSYILRKRKYKFLFNLYFLISYIIKILKMFT